MEGSALKILWFLTEQKVLNISLVFSNNEQKGAQAW